MSRRAEPAGSANAAAGGRSGTAAAALNYLWLLAQARATREQYPTLELRRDWDTSWGAAEIVRRCALFATSRGPNGRADIRRDVSIDTAACGPEWPQTEQIQGIPPGLSRPHTGQPTKIAHLPYCPRHRPLSDVLRELPFRGVADDRPISRYCARFGGRSVAGHGRRCRPNRTV